MPKGAVSAKPDTGRAATTKDRILDAAEALFVQRGYYGVSMRDITREADVPLAQANYHFGTKEGLFRAVIQRRAAENAGGMHDELARIVEAAGDRPPDVEAILRAFVTSFVDKSMRGGPGWKNYIRLMAQTANLPQVESHVRPFAEFYDPVTKEFVDELRRAMPGAHATDIHWYFYIYQAAITHILVESGIIDRQTDGLCKSSDLDTVTEKMIALFAAGFRAMAARPA